MISPKLEYSTQIKKAPFVCAITPILQRAIKKFGVKLENKEIGETYKLMTKVYGDDCMSNTQV